MSEKKFFVSSYAQLIISDYTVLAAIIAEHTKPLKQSQDEATSTELVAVERIQEALNGPYATFIETLIHAYGQLTQDRLAYARQNEDLLKAAEDEAQPATPPTKNIKSISQLDQMQKQIDDKANQHDQALNSFRQHWSHELIAQLKPVLHLNELEQDEIFVEEPLSEINKRFVELKLTQPKLKNANTFHAYFMLKATLSIHTALNRQHQPCTDKEIQQILKGLKTYFANLSKAEEAQLTKLEQDFK